VAKVPASSTPNPLSAKPLGGQEEADREAALAVVAKKVARCVRCAELVRNRTMTVFGSGNPHSRLVFMGEAPGADEDRQGLPFVGAAGQKLTKMIETMGLQRPDVYILNTIKCRPPNNRQPLPTEAANCREYLDRQLEILRPEVICCLGATAAQNLLGMTTPIGQMRGRTYEHRGIQVLCTYHPAYLLRNPSANKLIWKDLKRVLTILNLPVPQYPWDTDADE
jgi:DNA polymerase